MSVLISYDLITAVLHSENIERRKGSHREQTLNRYDLYTLSDVDLSITTRRSCIYSVCRGDKVDASDCRPLSAWYNLLAPSTGQPQRKVFQGPYRQVRHPASVSITYFKISVVKDLLFQKLQRLCLYIRLFVWSGPLFRSKIKAHESTIINCLDAFMMIACPFRLLSEL